MLYSIISGIAIVLVSFVGLFFTSPKIKKYLTKHLSFFVSFSAGVFFLVSFDLVKESIEMGPVSLVLVSAILGFIFFYVFEKIIPESHHHHGDDCDHPHKRKNSLKMLVGDAFHKVADGLIIFPAFIIGFSVGLVTVIGILIHEIIYNISEYFVLIDSGYTNKQALTRNALTSFSVFIGIFLGSLILYTEDIQVFFLSFSAGAFLYLVFHDLIPLHLFRTDRAKAFKHILFFVAGIGVLFLATFHLPH